MTHPTNTALSQQPELAHPYHILAPHCTLTLASPLGGEAPLDPLSIKAFESDKLSTDFLNNNKDFYTQSIPLSTALPQAQAGKFDAVFYVGGYGPMFDLVSDTTSAELVQTLYTQNKVLSGVCHGPAVFARVTVAETGKRVLDGHKVTGVSNKECELLFPQSGVVEPWNVEDALLEAVGVNGGYSKAEPYGEEVVVSKGADGRTFVTGQNPSSGLGAAKALYKELFGKEYGG